MTILGIDPGTHCGWAYLYGSETMISGVWNLKGGRFEGYGMRFVRMRNLLEENNQTGKPDLVAFEEVRRHMGVDAAHIYGGVVAVISAWCEQNKVPYHAIPVQHIKKLATGKGNANKEAMLAAAKERWPTWPFVDDNEADARFIALHAATEFSKQQK